MDGGTTMARHGAAAEEGRNAPLGCMFLRTDLLVLERHAPLSMLKLTSMLDAVSCRQRNMPDLSSSASVFVWWR